MCIRDRVWTVYVFYWMESNTAAMGCITFYINLQKYEGIKAGCTSKG